MRIDAHQHFWNYSADEYAWIEPDTMAALARSYGPADLEPHLARHGFSGSVAVQARQHEGENAFLLGLAARAPAIRAVVGWVDLAAPDAAASLERWAAHDRFRGVRHIAQGEAPGFLLREPFVEGVRLLPRFGLTYDILIYARQLPEAIAFVDRCPDVSFVVDHAAKPDIRGGAVADWEPAFRALAERPNTCCKLSGLVTEADHARWSAADIEPCLQAALDAFGADRLMFGSDWPVCLLAAGYDRVYDLVASFVFTLSADEQAAIMGRTASRFYGLASS